MKTNTDKLSISAKLWEIAYQNLEPKDAEILKDHAGKLAELNNILIDKALYQQKSREWSLTLAGKSFRIREIGMKIVQTIDLVQDYLQQLASIEPHAAVAVTCISLLLPWITRYSTEEEAMLAGLDRVSYLVDFYAEWERLYAGQSTGYFQEAVIKVYTAILSYQARLLYYLSRGTVNKVARSIFKKGEWKDWLEEVNRRNQDCSEHAKLADISLEREARLYQHQHLQTQSETAKLILTALNDQRQQQLQKISQTKRNAFLQTLYHDYETQKDVNPVRVQGTCEWFVADKRFTDWHSSKRSCLLHVFAGPGCGKSVLARYLVDSDVLRSPDTVVLYFFFKANQQGQERCADALASMLHQLYTTQNTAGIVACALQRFEQVGATLATVFKEMWNILRESLEDPAAGEIICVFDALDECLENDRNVLLTTLTDYFEKEAREQKSKGRLKVLITSRPYLDISSEYDRFGTTSTILQLDGRDKSDLIAKEIGLVIEFAVPRVLSKVSSEIQQAVMKHLHQIENRTYLWLHLILDEIKKNLAGKRTERRIKELIAKLPDTVNAAYQSMLQRSDDHERARVLLHIVVAARRPLTVSELKIASALADNVSYKSYKDLCGDTEDSALFKDSLQHLCGLMLTVHDSRVYLIHQTAREFLCDESFIINGRDGWQGPIQVPAAEAIIAEACVSFLDLEDFTTTEYSKRQFYSKLYDSSPSYHSQLADQYSFLKYAACNWLSHGQAMERTSRTNILERQINLCTSNSNVWCLWHPLTCDSNGLGICTDATGLFPASFSGYTELFGMLLARGADANTVSDRYGSILEFAIYDGHEQIVKMLLAKGADANTVSDEYGSVLHFAINGENEQIIKMLLAEGADVNAVSDEYGSVLYLAISKDNEQIVKMLLAEGADVNAVSNNYGSVLDLAISKDNEQIVKMLLAEGADANTVSDEYGSVLHFAISKDNKQIVKMLLAEGADVNADSDEYGSILSLAACEGNKEIVKMLLAEGADVNAISDEYGSILHSAVQNGNKQIVKILLAEGADVNADSDEWGSILSLAVYKGNKEIVKMLLAKGADINASADAHGYTPLIFAICAENEGIVEILIAKGADVNARSGGWSLPLYCASYEGSDSIVKTLLTKGADINTRDDDTKHGTALQVASANGHKAIVETLLANGARVSIQSSNKLCSTALQAALYYGEEDVVKVLLAHGAKIDAEESFYGNLFQTASLQGNRQIVEMLLGHGVDVNSRGGKHGSALQAALLSGQNEIVQVLIDAGAKSFVDVSPHVTSVTGPSEQKELNLASGPSRLPDRTRNDTSVCIKASRSSSGSSSSMRTSDEEMFATEIHSSVGDRKRKFSAYWID